MKDKNFIKLQIQIEKETDTIQKEANAKQEKLYRTIDTLKNAHIITEKQHSKLFYRIH
mgnify:CR=1 FL=1